MALTNISATQGKNFSTEFRSLTDPFLVPYFNVWRRYAGKHEAMDFCCRVWDKRVVEGNFGF